MMRRFKCALITGATGGLGKALCTALSAHHIPLILVARDANKLDQLAAQLPGVKKTYAVNLTLAQERKEFLAHLREQTPDLIVNNAGMGAYGPALQYPTSKHLEITELNIQATLEITLEGARALLEADKQGTIVNISSAAAFFAYPTHCVYAASKSFINQFSQGLNHELRSKAIHVLASCPGQIDTPFSWHASAGHPPRKKGFLTLSPDTAARCIIKQIENNRPLEIIDWRYKCLVRLGQILPQKWMMRLLQDSLIPEE